MKVEMVINLYADCGTKVEIGDRVAIETAKDMYVGKVKSLKPKMIGVSLDVGGSVGILYENIKSFMVNK